MTRARAAWCWAVAAVACLAAPGAAWGHAVIRVSAGEVSYLSEDATAANQLNVRLVGPDIEFHDPAAGDGGIDPGSCRPGDVNSRGEVIQVFCRRANLRSMRIEVLHREDRVVAAVDLPSLLQGGGGSDNLNTGDPADLITGDDGNDTIHSGGGNDQVKGGEGDDTIFGDAGDDVLEGGLGVDRVEGGAGTDDMRVRDGLADVVVCGEGVDRVDADTFDDVASDCEGVNRTNVAPPAGGGSGGPDSRPPRVRVGGSTLQRVGRRRTVRVAATSSERGTVAATGFLTVGSLRFPVTSPARRVSVAGGGVELRIRLSNSQLRACRRAFRSRRRVFALVSVVATDRAGNSSVARRFRIRLRR
jgi:hypothetical protein